MPLAESFNPYKGKDKLKIAPRGVTAIQFGAETIDLADLEQLVDISQTSAIAHAIHYASRYMNGGLSLRQLVERVMQDIRENGLDILPPYVDGEMAEFRGIDLAAAINRMRSLKIRQL
jgi:hypothetical protein